MARFFQNVFAKPVQWVVAVLTNIKVFIQILAIILILVAFLLIEGLNGHQIIGEMQKVTRQVFSESVQGQRKINDVRIEIENFRNVYLLKLAQVNTVLDADTMTLESTIASLSTLDSESANAMTSNIEKLNEILSRPESPENYEDLNQVLNEMAVELQTLERKAMLSATGVMNFGNRFSADSQKITLILTLVGGIIAILLGLGIAASVSKPMRQIVNDANALAVGDFSKNLEAQGCREVNEVVKGLNNAVFSLRNLVGGINEQSKSLLDASNELREASNISGKSAAEMARAMEDLAKASTEQADQISRMAETVNDLGELVRKVSADTERIAVTSVRVADSAKAGQEISNAVANEIHEVYNTTKIISDVIEDLNQTSGEISDITSVIEGVAEQTTLLALNASIEAARAGEHGKGFSVVAKETGKLAEQSKRAAQMIADLLVQMKVRTEHAVTVIQTGAVRVEAGKNLASEATTKFGEIFKVLNEMLGQIHNVAIAAREMAQKNELVIASVEAVASISEESMASTEEVSATAEEQSAEAEQVKAMAENMAGIAAELKKAVTVFKAG